MDRFVWLVAWRNLRKSPGLSLLVLVVVGTSVALVIFLAALIAGVELRMIRSSTDALAHIMVMPPDREPLGLWERLLPRSAAGLVPGLGRELFRGEKVKLQQVRDRIDDWMLWQPRLAGLDPAITAVSPVVEGQALLTRGAKEEAVRVIGIDPALHDGVLGFTNKLVAGRYQPLNSGEALVGTKLCDLFGVRIGDKIRLQNSRGGSGQYLIVGNFNAGARELDERTAFVSLREGQMLFDLGRAISMFDLKVRDSMQAEVVATQLRGRLPYKVESWITRNASLMTALEGQHSSSTIIIFFTAVAAGFAMASMMLTAVMSRITEIGVLRAIGAGRGQILGIFALQGVLLAAAGALAGCLAGCAFTWAVAQIPAKDPTLTGGYKTLFTIQLTTALVVNSFIGATLVSLAASLYPALRATRVDPIEVIRGR